MPKKRLIPFRWLPGSWGLAGQTYDEAEAAYYLEGEELERRLIDIRHGDNPTEKAKQLLALDLKYGRLTPYQHDMRMLELNGLAEDRRAKLDVDFKHGQISEYDFGKAIVELEEEGVEREISLLDLDLKFGRVSPREHEKAVATLREEPWVGIVNDEFDLNQGINGFAIELDWNEHWITYLKLNGYVGHTDEQIVDQWFAHVCRTMGEDAQQQLAFNEMYPQNHRRLTNRIDRGDGRADYL